MATSFVTGRRAGPSWDVSSMGEKKAEVLDWGKTAAIGVPMDSADRVVAGDCRGGL